MNYAKYATDEEALAKAEILFMESGSICRLCVVKNSEGTGSDEVFAFFPEVYDSMTAAIDGWLEKSSAPRAGVAS